MATRAIREDDCKQLSLRHVAQVVLQQSQIRQVLASDMHRHQRRAGLLQGTESHRLEMPQDNRQTNFCCRDGVLLTQPKPHSETVGFARHSQKI